MIPASLVNIIKNMALWFHIIGENLASLRGGDYGHHSSLADAQVMTLNDIRLNHVLSQDEATSLKVQFVLVDM